MKTPQDDHYYKRKFCLKKIQKGHQSAFFIYFHMPDIWLAVLNG